LLVEISNGKTVVLVKFWLVAEAELKLIRRRRNIFTL